MKIRNVSHKGLRRFIEKDDPSGLPAGCTEKIRNIVSFLLEIGDAEEVRSIMVRMARPSHPGQFIRMEIIEPLGLTVTDAAKALGVTRPALSALLNQRAALSPEMALRIEKAFGVKMDTLVRMQTAFEIAATRQREGEIKVARYAPKKGARAGANQGA